VVPGADAGGGPAPYRCVVRESLDSRALSAVSDAVLTIAAERSFEPVLEKLADAARELADARYAAIGVPDGEGGFANFIASGMSAKQWEAIGELPRQHGLLGAMLAELASYRTPDISEDPRFEGWPEAHPHMRSFLGVPIVSKSEVVGAFYLTDKKGGRRAVFTDTDQQLIELLAAHAAVAIENARLHERSRELTIVEERNRLARELHDAVSQSLFSIALTAEAAAQLVDVDPARAHKQLRIVHDLTRAATEEMRSLIFELRGAELGSDGLVSTLRKHVEVLRRIYGTEIEIEVEGDRPLRVELEKHVFRIAQEALGNALKHAHAEKLEVQLRMSNGRVELSVADDGAGFDPASPLVGKHLGLLSMRERAQALGGELNVISRPGAGTTVTLEVDVGGSDSRFDR
jgi:signal transduction histidine kinase